MGKKNKNKNKNVFNPPLRHPQINNQNAAIMAQIRAAYDKEMVEASNQGFNLALSSALLAFSDMGMKEYIQEFKARIFGICDDVADNAAMIKNIMNEVEQLGINVLMESKERLEHDGKFIANKTAVFECLANGIEEIGQILAKCKQSGLDIDYRDVCGYKWQYDREKYAELMEVDMSIKDEAFKIIKQDESISCTDLSIKLKITKQSASQYKYLYKKEKVVDEEMAKQRVKAFELIENGADKKELMDKLGVSDAVAIRLLAEYRDQNGGDIEVTTSSYKEKAFAMFEQGMSDSKVRDALYVSDAKSKQLKKEWVDQYRPDFTTEEMAEILAGTDPSIIILRKNGVLPEKKEKAGNKDGAETKTKKHFEPRKTGEVDKNINETEETTAKEERTNVTEDSKQEGTYKYVDLPNGLKKKVKVVEVVETIEGEFATYTPVQGDLFDIEVNGQVITMNRNSMKTLANELMAVAEA